MDDVTNMLTIWVFFCYQGMWTLYTFFLEKSIIWVTNEFVSGQIDNKKMLMRGHSSEIKRFMIDEMT